MEARPRPCSTPPGCLVSGEIRIYGFGKLVVRPSVRGDVSLTLGVSEARTV
jgi:hypothetical protein